MDNIIAETAQTASEDVTTKTKVLAAVAVTAYFGACYAGGFVIGKLITRRRNASTFSQNNFFDEHVFNSDTSN